MTSRSAEETILTQRFAQQMVLDFEILGAGRFLAHLPYSLSDRGLFRGAEFRTKWAFGRIYVRQFDHSQHKPTGRLNK
jgi:hypothetical protein